MRRASIFLNALSSASGDSSASAFFAASTKRACCSVGVIRFAFGFFLLAIATSFALIGVIANCTEAPAFRSHFRSLIEKTKITMVDSPKGAICHASIYGGVGAAGNNPRVNYIVRDFRVEGIAGITSGRINTMPSVRSLIDAEYQSQKRDTGGNEQTSNRPLVARVLLGICGTLLLAIGFKLVGNGVDRGKYVLAAIAFPLYPIGIGFLLYSLLPWWP